MNEHSKYRALYLLSQKVAPKEIAEEVELSYATVLRYKKEYEDADRDDRLKELLDFPQAVLEDILELAKDRAPVTIEDEIVVLAESLTGLKKLERDLQLTATTVTAKIRSMAMGAESAGELSDLTDSLCAIQTAFFAPGTQVNIQNNIGQSAPGASFEYGDMLDDKPKNL